MTDLNTATPAKDGLHRSLKPRHLNMIAIGGSIGTGLFVASGATVASAGPGGALLAYALIGLMVYFLYGYRKSHVARGLVETHEQDADVPPQPVPPLPGAPTPGGREA